MALLRILEDLLNGIFVVGVAWELATKNKNSQAATREKVRPGICFAGGQIGFQFFPAESAPERLVAQNGEGYVEKQKDRGVPEDVGAERNCGLLSK